MLIGQTVLLGEMVDYFTNVSTVQYLECIGQGNMSSGDMLIPVMSSTNAYLYALGKKNTLTIVFCNNPRVFP